MSSHIRGTSKPRLWRKVLYEKQDVPDNYVDESFLNDMKKNLYLREYDFKTLVLNSSRITQQLNAVVLLAMCYVHLSETTIQPHIVISLSGVVILLSYLVTKWTEYKVNLKAILVYSAASYALSPVLMSLTNTISTDTVYAMTVSMFILHLFSHEYRDLPSEMSGVVSLNAVTFGTICLASRLKSDIASFSLILLSIFLFAVFPNVRRLIRSRVHLYYDFTLSLLLVATATMLVVNQSFALAILNALGFVFITFLCPILLLWLQPLKNNIYGPWDEAVVGVMNQ